MLAKVEEIIRNLLSVGSRYPKSFVSVILIAWLYVSGGINAEKFYTLLNMLVLGAE